MSRGARSQGKRRGAANRMGGMNGLTLEQAARESGRSARELRLTIEAGDLPAVQRGGRWVVDPVDLSRHIEPAADPESPARPGRHLTEVVTPPADAPSGHHPVDELLARLETRAVEVATLREKLGSRTETDSRVESLERELSATRMELEQARRRIDELEGGGDARPAARRQPAMRDALTPLFERTREPDSGR